MLILLSSFWDSCVAWCKQITRRRWMRAVGVVAVRRWHADGARGGETRGASDLSRWGWKYSVLPMLLRPHYNGERPGPLARVSSSSLMTTLYLGARAISPHVYPRTQQPWHVQEMFNLVVFFWSPNLRQSRWISRISIDWRRFGSNLKLLY